MLPLQTPKRALHFVTEGRKKREGKLLQVVLWEMRQASLTYGKVYQYSYFYWRLQVSYVPRTSLTLSPLFKFYYTTTAKPELPRENPYTLPK